MSSEYERGFKMGWLARSEVDFAKRQGDERESSIIGREKYAIGMQYQSVLTAPKKRKRPQTGKAKLLTTMTKKKWDKYKKGSGKKTYVEIRAQVSKSQDYKKACKRKGFK